MTRELVDIACRVVVETDKAYCIHDGTKEVWLPKSLVEWHQTPGKAFGIMVIPYFLAHERGLI